METSKTLLLQSALVTWILIGINLPTTTYGQVQVTGIVRSFYSNEPLRGAIVYLKGATINTTCDSSGYFVLQVPRLDTTIMVSHLGFIQQEVHISLRQHLEIFLVPDPVALNEVVVVGYSTQRKRDISGAVTVVEVDKMQKYAASSFEKKLEGQAAGVNIFTSGEPGARTNIRIRGFSSFLDNTPLIIVDGVPIVDGNMQWLNPNDIDKIQILKDASAASVYGSRANNGVIIVETKKGKAGKPKITYNSYVGFQNMIACYNNFLINDPQEYAQYIWDSYNNAGIKPPSNLYGSGNKPVLPDYLWPDKGQVVDESKYAYPSNAITKANKNGTNWCKEALVQNSPMTEQNLNVSGGSDRGSFSLSAGYLNQQGILNYSHFKRYSLRANSSIKAGHLVFGENIALAQSEQVFTPVNLFAVLPILPVRDIQGNFAGNRAAGTGGDNPVAALYRGKDNTNTQFNVLGAVFSEFQIIPSLKAKTSLGFNFGNGTNLDFTYPALEARPNDVNRFLETWTRNYSLTWTNTLNFQKDFGSHHLNILAGYEVISTRNRFIGGFLKDYFATNKNVWYLNAGLANPSSRDVFSTGDIFRILSSFGKLDYQFSNKYIMSH
jgi:TonB-linked SusC/RagA family outer membrane protein